MLHRKSCNRVIGPQGIGETLTFKKVILGMISFMIVSGQIFSALAQDESAYPAVQVTSVKGESTYGTPPPGQVGGPVLNHPELNTPEDLKDETEAIKEYCRTHRCGSSIVESRPANYGESIDRAQRAWAASHRPGVADRSNTIVGASDPAHPSGPDICYRVSDHRRVYPGTPGKN